MSTAPGAPEPIPAAGSRKHTHGPLRDRPGTAPHPVDSARPPGPQPGSLSGDLEHTADPLASGAVATVGAAVAVAIPFSFPPGGGWTWLDRSVDEQIRPRFDPYPWVAEVLALATGTGVVFTLLCGSALWFAWHRRWWAAATAALVPELAVVVNTWVLKPLWDRPLHDYLAYPSGHTVHLVSVVTTATLLLRSARARIVLVLLTVAGWCAGAVGMVALGYHLITDVLGGAAAGITLAVAGYWISVWLARAYTAARAR